VGEANQPDQQDYAGGHRDGSDLSPASARVFYLLADMIVIIRVTILLLLLMAL
jgi:hypothetical protein